MPRSSVLPGVAEAAPVLRLLLITDTAVGAAGGSERFLRNLVSLLPPSRYLVTLVQLAGHDMAGDAQALFPVEHVTLLSLPIGPIYGARALQAWRTLRALLQREPFDIVQSQHEKSDLLNAMLPRRAGAVRISNRRDMGFNKSAKLTRLFRLVNPRFDAIVAPAQPILNAVRESEGVDLQRLVWIPNGVDTVRFAPRPDAERRAMRQALGVDQTQLLFGCVASLTPVKRHVDLVTAFAQVHGELPGSRLLLVGDGPLRDALHAQVASAGLGDAVLLPGDRPDVEDVLPALDVGVLTSSTEGMSNAILEMMACGLPMVATAVGGNPQLVRAEESGLLVPAFDPAALAGAMLALARAPDLRARYGAAARARIEAEFSLAAMVASFDQLYLRLLQQRAAAVPQARDLAAMS